MPKWRLIALLAALALCSLLIASCSDDSDDSVKPSNDTTAPLVATTWPENDQTGVAPGSGLVAIFNEDMDQTSAAGNVTLSHGDITALTWEDERTLVIAHSDFAGEGLEVTATLGTGLKDVAGNGLAAPYSWSFYTQSTALTLLDHQPEAGAVDVPRQPMIRLLFSDDMNMSTMYGAIMVTDAPVPMKKAAFSYDLERGEGDWYHLTFPAPLPPDAQIWVTITTSAQASDGRNLSSIEIFSFHTSTDADTTPPQLVSIVPPSGMIDPSTASVVMTFDEPIDPGSIREKGFSAELQILIMNGLIGQPTWNDGFTEMTIVLPTPLTAGLPLEFVIDQFADLAGNIQQTDVTYSVVVGGSPDYYPVEDEGVMAYSCFSRGGYVGMPAMWDDHYQTYHQFDVQSGGNFLLKEFRDSSLSPEYLEGWDKMAKTSSRIYLGGFYEIQEGGGTEDVAFDDQATYLKQPIVQGDSWSGSSDVTVVYTPTVGDPEQFSAGLSYSAEVLPMIERLPVGSEGEPSKLAAARLFRAPAADELGVYWMNVWPVELSHTFSVGSETVASGTDTLYYAPGRGLIQQRMYETDYDGPEPEWDQEYRYWFPYETMILVR